ILWVDLAATVTEPKLVILPPVSQNYTDTSIQKLDKIDEEIFCRLVISNITLRKRTEENNTWLQSKIQQSVKMESVGRLAGGVAHEFNNMLSVILGYTEMGMDIVNHVNPLFDNLHEIRHAAERCAELTRQLLTFSSNQPVMPRVLDLNNALERILTMLVHLIGEDTEFVWEPGKDLWQVKVDPSQIDNILAVFCINARNAFDARNSFDGVNKFSIVTANISVDETSCLNNIDAIPGDYVKLMVTDNGCGMDSETIEHIFEPFFTTKEFGRGSGLGLIAFAYYPLSFLSL
ncbi:MAG: hypothetical protein HQK63_16060, partial [Desulfamplus sp.]|nr:hypothetical protein [Desulfamplus sp.]